MVCTPAGETNPTVRRSPPRAARNTPTRAESGDRTPCRMSLRRSCESSSNRNPPPERSRLLLTPEDAGGIADLRCSRHVERVGGLRILSMLNCSVLTLEPRASAAPRQKAPCNGDLGHRSSRVPELMLEPGRSFARRWWETYATTAPGPLVYAVLVGDVRLMAPRLDATRSTAGCASVLTSRSSAEKCSIATALLLAA
jgi:hypothetical protein